MLLAGLSRVGVNSLGIFQFHVKVLFYVFQLILRWTFVEGVSQQFEAVKKGFEMVFPLSNLKLFYPEEVKSPVAGLPARQLTIIMPDTYSFIKVKVSITRFYFIIYYYIRMNAACILTVYCLVKKNPF